MKILRVLTNNGPCYWNTVNMVVEPLMEKSTVSFLHSLFFCFVSVGNKNDAPDRKVVETNDAQRFAQQMGIQLFETSAKENLNVEEVSDEMLMLVKMYRCMFSVHPLDLHPSDPI